MYLISAYFDENTNRVLQGYIEKVAKATGNDFMVANHVPPHYVSPYLNEYLQNLEQQVFDCFKDIPNTTISSCYRPFSWLPHITLAKTLTREQMLAAVQVMENFKSLDASIVGLGLAKVNPHQDVRLIDLH